MENKIVKCKCCGRDIEYNSKDSFINWSNDEEIKLWCVYCELSYYYIIKK